MSEHVIKIFCRRTQKSSRVLRHAENSSEKQYKKRFICW